jgi:hypothetical protein
MDIWSVIFGSVVASIIWGIFYVQLGIRYDHKVKDLEQTIDYMVHGKDTDG